MADWLEELIDDERWYLVKEMKEERTEGMDNPKQLEEVRLAEKVLKYLRGSMQEAGWTNGRA